MCESIYYDEIIIPEGYEMPLDKLQDACALVYHKDGYVEHVVTYLSIPTERALVELYKEFKTDPDFDDRKIWACDVDMLSYQECLEEIEDDDLLNRIKCGFYILLEPK